MPPEHLRRGEDFIEELAGRMFGQEGQTKAKVGGNTQYNLPSVGHSIFFISKRGWCRLLLHVQHFICVIECLYRLLLLFAGDVSWLVHNVQSAWSISCFADVTSVCHCVA